MRRRRRPRYGSHPQQHFVTLQGLTITGFQAGRLALRQRWAVMEDWNNAHSHRTQPYLLVTEAAACPTERISSFHGNPTR